MPLSKSEILRKSFSKRANIYISSLEGEVTIKQLSSSDVLELYEKVESGEYTSKDYTYEVIRLSVIDEDGSLIYDENTVKELNVEVMTELSMKVAEFNNFDVEQLKDGVGDLDPKNALSKTKKVSS